jgi:hypothetical protein
MNGRMAHFERLGTLASSMDLSCCCMKRSKLRFT